MPIYDYICKTCGPFEERRPMIESSVLVPCPSCSIPASRMITAPQLNLMSSANRIAETRNEKSAHAPDVVHKITSHQPHSQEKRQHSDSRQHKPHRTSRPWMLGH